MKFILLFLFITISLLAQKNWISLDKPEKKEIKTQTYKSDINLSKPQSLMRLLQGAKIILPLIDKQTNRKKTNKKSDKKWFKIEKMNLD